MPKVLITARHIAVDSEPLSEKSLHLSPSCLRMSSQRLSLTSEWRGTGAFFAGPGIRINVVLLAMALQITPCLNKLAENSRRITPLTRFP